MEELIKSIRLRKQYNSMDFEEFVILVQEYIKKPIPKGDIEHWKFTGLNNTDFIEHAIIKYK